MLVEAGANKEAKGNVSPPQGGGAVARHAGPHPGQGRVRQEGRHRARAALDNAQPGDGGALLDIADRPALSRQRQVVPPAGCEARLSLRRSA